MAKYSKEPNGRELAYPADRFEELFSRWAPYDKKHPEWAKFVLITGASIGKALMGERKSDGTPDIEGQMAISPYCSVDMLRRERSALSVVPRLAVIESLQKHTIIVEHDTMSWEVIEWPGNAALVRCRHSLIIGDVWVAIIDARTVPVAAGEAR
jgi:hypothetical protein